MYAHVILKIYTCAYTKDCADEKLNENKSEHRNKSFNVLSLNK